MLSRLVPYAVVLVACTTTHYARLTMPGDPAATSCMGACKERGGDDSAILDCVKNCPSAKGGDGACDELSLTKLSGADQCVNADERDGDKTAAYTVLSVVVTAGVFLAATYLYLVSHGVGAP